MTDVAKEIACEVFVHVHDFVDVAACIHCDKDFSEFTYLGKKVSALSEEDNRAAIRHERIRAGNVSDRGMKYEAELWLSILVPALNRKTDNPRAFKTLFPEWDAGPFKPISYIYQLPEPKPMRLRDDLADAMSYAFGRSGVAAELDTKGKLYGVDRYMGSTSSCVLDLGRQPGVDRPMKKKNKTQKKTSKKSHLKIVKPLNVKMGFWLSPELIERMRAHVDQHRSAPELMTINSFVRDALEAKLPKRKARAA